MKTHPAGLLAEFDSAAALVAACGRVRAAGFTRLETFLPYPVPEAVALTEHPPSPIARAMAIGGFSSGLCAFFLQVYAARDYPLDIGGRPLFSWPAFIPITFELTVLGAALTGVASFFILARLPALDHAIFRDPRFIRASVDRFFLCVRGDDPRFDPEILQPLLVGTGTCSVEEMPQ